MRVIAGISVVFVSFVIGLWELHDLPASWYGDISIVHEYAQAILSKDMPWYISESAGPLYHYLIAPGVALFGPSYLTYKMMSVIVGLIGVLGVVALISELLGRGWGLAGGVLAGTSFWWLAWARTGNSQILIPALVSFTFWFLIRAMRSSKFFPCSTPASGVRLRSEKIGFTHASPLLFIGGIICALLGLFVYPQAWVLPFIYGIGLFVTRRYIPWKQTVLPMGIIGGIAILLFVVMVRNSSQVLSGGYLGSKIWPVFISDPIHTLWIFFSYALKAAGALHVKGDITFRVNVPGSPQLDIISGILFFLGAFSLMRTRRNIFLMGVSIMVILAIPSIIPTLPAEEIPNSGRMIGILPIVVVFVVAGLRWVYEHAGKHTTGILIACVISLNLYKYFVQYPKTLPNNNSPWGRIVAEYIDTFPQSTHVILTDCCWGQWGQPEPKAVYYQLNNKQERSNILAVQEIDCADIDRSTDILLIGRSTVSLWRDRLQSCIEEEQFTLHRDIKGQEVFGSVYLPRTSE